MFPLIRDVLFKNIPLKLIAVGLAVLVWYYIGQEITDKVEIAVPFQVQLPPNTAWRITGPETFEITLTLRGPHSDIQRLRTFWSLKGKHSVRPENLPLDRDEIHLQVPVPKESFHLPASEVEILDARPDSVDVGLLLMDDKTVRVVPSFSGEPGEGFIVEGRPRVDPEVVQVRGPRVVLKNLSEIPTLPIILSERTASFTERKGVVSNVDGYALECDKQISVEVDIRESPETRLLQNVRVYLSYPPGFPLDKYRITDYNESLSVSVQGPKSLLDLLDPGKVRIYALVAALKEPLNPGDTINENAKLHWELLGFTPEERARIKVVLEREDLLYTLTRIAE